MFYNLNLFDFGYYDLPYNISYNLYYEVFSNINNLFSNLYSEILSNINNFFSNLTILVYDYKLIILLLIIILIKIIKDLILPLNVFLIERSETMEFTVINGRPVATTGGNPGGNGGDESF